MCEEARVTAAGTARGLGRRLAPAWLAVLCLVQPAATSAQEDVIARARSTASAGQRTEALTMLAVHLGDSPRDVDARLTYGLMLSWAGRYDEARAELERVLTQSPEYADARVALMNVEWWSGHTAAAKGLVEQILARDPGNAEARLVQQRLDARSKPWKVSTYYAVDRFSDRAAWQEVSTTLGRETPAGTVLARITSARRFGHTDQLVEVEAYPTIRAGTYAFVGVGAATTRNVFPASRVSFDLYQSVGHGVEVSGGYRRLNFAGPVSIYVGTLTKWAGNWALIGRTFMVPSRPSDSWSFHGETRRYFGSTGTSFLALTYSQGFWREDRSGPQDLSPMHAHTVRGQGDIELSPSTRFQVNTSVSREDRTHGGPLWQLSISTGAAYKF